ncbi:5-methyltetrahydropteroyltriglutamate--homocysteine S-methyltransferase [Balneolaceae bacterium ANBcel3]|nr:5-methyltetrahydropteroyltriglutamate--homocysteine S-methyltransferase [Balneolaceae bacterium ANBcel3]
MTNNTLISGFPRIGENRELKIALERYWAGTSEYLELEKTAKALREKHWLEQKQKGIEYISSNDFSYYDHILDTSVMLNAIPKRFRSISDPAERYFAMARGTDDAAAMEMTKWFNTNYHFIVPELDNDTPFQLNEKKIIQEYTEAKASGLKPKINLIGPITFVGLSKAPGGKDPFEYFDRVLSVYKELLATLDSLDDSITLQIDEPIFVKNPETKLLSLIKSTYDELSLAGKGLRIICNTYFEHACEAVEELAKTPIWAIGLDFIYGKSNLQCLEHINEKKLVAGVVDGRNIWADDLDYSLDLLNRISEIVPKDQIIVSTSCSLLHVPYSLRNEPESEIKSWLAFAVEKVEEVALLGKVFLGKPLSEVEKQTLEKRRSLFKVKKNSSLITNPSVTDKLKRISVTSRDGAFEERIKLQKKALNLPSLPTTTIGSFPQTPEIRKVRLDFKKGRISNDTYESEIKKYIDDCVAFQEQIGLDVLVHGEPERNDMVEYFGELLDGFLFTKNGWVQSYGSRCVKPPVIYGDVNRTKPMTVKWIRYAQSRTKKIMKGMLTGPVTIINWSFVRNDLPRSVIAKQIALAISEEISDLQDASIKVIQVDEAALKEGYPLREKNIKEYEKWAVDSFKLAVSTANKETQIHTHMCYSDFNDITKTIEEMDADVITIETARSGNRLLRVFHDVSYKNEIGPGVYDIHSPRIPTIDEFKNQIKERLLVVDRAKMWVNPDCGLKTRRWEEVKPALTHMVQATMDLRN